MHTALDREFEARGNGLFHSHELYIPWVCPAVVVLQYLPLCATLFIVLQALLADFFAAISREMGTLGGYGTGGGARDADGLPASFNARVASVSCGGGFTLAVTNGGKASNNFVPESV